MTAETSTESGARLRPTVGIYGAVSLAVGIVVGAGMLSLPGLVYREAGGWAVLAWILDGVLVVPLLFVFAALGRRFPTAGGVAGFVGQAFPWLRMGCSYLLVGTFGLGIPAIAITGAGYLAAVTGLPSGPAGRWVVAALAAGTLLGVLGMAWLGSRVAGTVQNAVVTLLVGVLLAVIASAAPHWGSVEPSAGDPTWHGVWRGMALAFFAYTGWEMLAFTAEEFKNPRRDFPLAVAISFVLVLALYVGAALSVQAAVSHDHELAITAPFLAVIASFLGGGSPVAVMALVVVAIIVTNLNGACWAASRLIFDVGRNGWAPAALALGRLAGTQHVPRPAIVGLALVLSLALVGYGAGAWDLADLLRVAGQNFFLLYSMSILTYVKLADTRAKRLFGLATLGVCVLFAGVFGWALAYAALLFLLPYGIVRLAALRSARRAGRPLGLTDDDVVRSGAPAFAKRINRRPSLSPAASIGALRTRPMD